MFDKDKIKERIKWHIFRLRHEGFFDECKTVMQIVAFLFLLIFVFRWWLFG